MFLHFFNHYFTKNKPKKVEAKYIDEIFKIVNNIKNDKVNEEIRSYAEGFRRSGTVKGELADIKLIARLNPSVLLKVAQKYGVRDLTL